MRIGQLEYDRAKVMADGVAGLSEELTRRLDADLIGDALARTKTQLRHKLNRAVKAADPTGTNTSGTTGQPHSTATSTSTRPTVGHAPDHAPGGPRNAAVGRPAAPASANQQTFRPRTSSPRSNS